MAISSLRLRRALAVSSSILNLRPFSSAATLSPPFFSPASISSSNPRSSLISPSRPGVLSFLPSSAIQFLFFRSSAPSCDRRSFDGDDRKIDPDEILFEGCDYNHWLITMEFPKDPKPTPEEMVETYVQTLAKVVGSVEEAKKRMYACSTTTYNGFQAVMTEEMSEKFRGLPGVVFILPDSYIDPVNKEYGGDKYDNGVITPRPPPVQYGRQGRYGDRNRNYDRPRFDRQQGPPPQQSNYGSPDRRGYGPGEGRDGFQREPYQGHQGPLPHQPNYGSPERRGYGPGEGRDGFQREPYQTQQGPPPQPPNYGSPERRGFGPGEERDGRFPQGPPPRGNNFPQGQGYGGGYNQGPPPGQNFSRPGEDQGNWSGPNQGQY